MARKKMDLNDALLSIGEQIVSNVRSPNIKKYQPHEKQYIFHHSRKKKKLYIGGNRSGKTTGGVTEAIWRATGTHPYRPELNNLGPTRGRVVAVDFVQGVEKIIFPQYKQWLYPSAYKGGSWESAYSPSTRTLTFSNGSTIEFMSYDQALDKFAGTSRHWVHFDEEPPKPIFGECLARLVDTNGDYWITMTPVEGVTWIYDDLYEPNIQADEPDVEIIEINTYENPFLTEEGISNFTNSIGEEERNIRIGGAFVRKGGRVYPNFDPTVGFSHVLSESILDPKTYFPESKWMWILALDSGLNNPTAVLWLAVNDDGFIVIFDEHYKAGWTVDLHAEAIKKKIRQHGRYPDLLVADPAIKQKSIISGTSVHEEYLKYDLAFTLGNNDVKSGITRVRRYFNYTTYPPSDPASRHPLYGGKAVPPGSTDAHIMARPDEHGRFVRMVVDPRCINTIHELKGYRWKTYSDKKKEYENNPFDEPHKKDDHACDALRYAIMSRPDLVANNNEPTPAAAVQGMRERGLLVSQVDNWEVDDPNSVLARNPMWLPGDPMPRESSFTVDEHMGGFY